MSRSAQLPALALALLTFLSVPAAAGPAEDLADLAACLTGGGVEARIAARIAPDGGATGTLSATFTGVDAAALERLVERANEGLAKQTERLAGQGVAVGRLALIASGGERILRTTASATAVERAAKSLSPHDPVEFSATRMNDFLVVRVAPRPALFLLAPFVRGLTVEVSLPADPAAHNADRADGRTLRWASARGFPAVEFSLGLDPRKR